MNAFRVILTLVFCFFFTSSAFAKTLNVFLVGPGGVGSCVLDQIHALQNTNDVEIRVLGIANSKKMYFDANGIALDSWRTKLQESKEMMAISSFVDKMISLNKLNTVFVDCTASQVIADSYVGIFGAKISVVTPNKKANSGSFQRYKMQQKLVTQKKVAFYYDTNVGAGLPIIRTLKSLYRSGDEIMKIEGVLSGTLSYLFNSFGQGDSFCEIVKTAHSKGYTEPDPRDDLNGMDVARKLLILAREIGFELEIEDIIVERFLPDACFEAPTVSAFYDCLKAYDTSIGDMAKRAFDEGKRLRCIASLENGKARISVEAVGEEHPFYHLRGTDNIVSITTKQYKSPLVIKGPGAGHDLTAARVIEGIIQVAGS